MLLLLKPHRQLSYLNDFFRSVIFHIVKVRLRLRSNPRMILLISMVATSILGSLLIAILVQIVIGLLAITIFGYLGYHILKFIAKQLASYIAVDKSAITVCKHGEENQRYLWEDVTFAGHVYVDTEDELLYFYIEGTDQLVTISPEFENFQLLRSQLSLYISTNDIELSAGESLSERLKKQFSL